MPEKYNIGWGNKNRQHIPIMVDVELMSINYGNTKSIGPQLYISRRMHGSYETTWC